MSNSPSTPEDAITSQPIPLGMGKSEEVEGDDNVDEKTNFNTTTLPSYGADDTLSAPVAGSGDDTRIQK